VEEPESAVARLCLTNSTMKLAAEERANLNNVAPLCRQAPSAISAVRHRLTGSGRPAYASGVSRLPPRVVYRWDPLQVRTALRLYLRAERQNRWGNRLLVVHAWVRAVIPALESTVRQACIRYRDGTRNQINA